MNQEEMIWQYLDGQADEETRARVDKLREEDPAFRLAFEERLKLHHSLKNIPLASPSLRFAKNVVDRLPLKVVPLIPRAKMRAIAIGSVAFLIAWTALGLFAGGGGTDPTGLGGVIEQTILQAVYSLPSSSLELISALGLGVFLLFLADPYLKKAFGKGEHKKTIHS